MALPPALAEKKLFPEPQGNYSGFKRSLSETPYGYQVVKKPFPVRAGKYAERFEIRYGDCSKTKDWNDCTSDRERSELVQRPPRAALDREYWYAWSLYVPDNYKNIYPVKVALGQFHQEGAEHPPLMFQNDRGGYWADRNQLHKKPVLLISEENLRGRWHDFVMAAVWSSKKNGRLRIWVDGQLKLDETGPTTQKTGKVFFKYGIYRSFLSRASDKKLLPSQVVYFDEVKWGPTREKVAPPPSRDVQKN